MQTQLNQQQKQGQKKFEALEKFCVNITQKAKAGSLDPVIGRHEEVRRVMQILSRRTKNNPVLIGQPGVGKTAIVEGIAQRIVAHDVPESLKDKQIFALDLGLLVAGAKYQGELEERLKSLLKEIESATDELVLFIDELHMLVGIGSSGGGMDVANLLKPALARGQLHCIGATTIAEYKKYIEKDAALERRFQPVLIEEPTVSDTISIVRGLKPRLELHHKIHIKDSALIDAVRLSAQHISDRFLPDKAIDLIDEAAAMVKMNIDSQPEIVDQLEREVRQLEIEKVALGQEKDNAAAVKRLQLLDAELEVKKQDLYRLQAQWKAEKEPLEKINTINQEMQRYTHYFQLAEREGDFARASEIKYGIMAKLKREFAEQKKKIEENPPFMLKQDVDSDDIAKVLAKWTGIQAARLQQSDAEKLLAMEDALHERVVGQNEAITVVTNAIQVHRAGIGDQQKPIGTFLFLGPTGVGKTEIAKTVAQFLFDDEKKLIRIDMSEYSERHTVARLIGSPPGYVGYEEGGQLTEKIRKNPYAVILCDEVEKAHPDVHNIFLQMLDEGRLTDGQGRTVSCKNCIIIMTSNIGSDLLLASPVITEAVKMAIENRLLQVFKPELVNRFDGICFFNALDRNQLVQIVTIQLKQLQRQLADQQIDLQITQSALEEIVERGYVKEFGARPLKRVIHQYVVVPVARYTLQKRGGASGTVTLILDYLQKEFLLREIDHM
ncbi:MAG TPA: AAA family ATPase [Patescibacteria group bacterium]|jgi:ATP-dependent Clp protease ATP-binding subunit ClpB|nr:AAA family ATPase [Patescibacteria group bacterium]